MKFKQLFEDDHLDLTHEVLTHHGFVKRDNGTYDYHHPQAENIDHGDLHQHLQSIGWKKNSWQIPRATVDGFNSGTAMFSKGFRTLGVSDGHGGGHYASATLYDGQNPIKG